MSKAAVDMIDSTTYETHEWLRDLMVELALEDRWAAYIGLRSALHGLRDGLPIEGAVHLGDQLPMLVRGFYYEGWNPIGKPLMTCQQEFLDAIRADLNRPAPGVVARAVFTVLSRRISPAEIERVKSSLPTDLRRLWPD